MRILAAALPLAPAVSGEAPPAFRVEHGRDPRERVGERGLETGVEFVIVVDASTLIDEELEAELARAHFAPRGQLQGVAVLCGVVLPRGAEALLPGEHCSAARSKGRRPTTTLAARALELDETCNVISPDGIFTSLTSY